MAAVTAGPATAAAGLRAVLKVGSTAVAVDHQQGCFAGTFPGGGGVLHAFKTWHIIGVQRCSKQLRWQARPVYATHATHCCTLLHSSAAAAASGATVLMQAVPGMQLSEGAGVQIRRTVSEETAPPPPHRRAQITVCGEKNGVNARPRFSTIV